MSTPQSRQTPKGPKPKLLVVDDEPDNLDLLYRTFYREFQVLRADDGLAALHILATHPDVAVIISDQRMPGMSGTEFLRRTAADYPDIMRIILTGYTDVEDLVGAINEGKVFKYVTKPWDDVELKEIVRQALEAHRLLKARTAELNRALRQETLLNAITHTIRSAQTLHEMLQTIADTVGRTMDVSYCVLRPFYESSLPQSAYFTYCSPSHLSDDEITCRQADLEQTLWKTQEILLLDQPRDSSPAVAENPDRQVAFERLGIQSSLLIPLRYKQDLMAVLALHQCQADRVWEPSEVQLLVTLADQAALAVAQVQTYERIQALAQREALINTITTAIRSSLNPQKTFAAITYTLGQALQVDGCALSLWTEAEEFVQCVGLYNVEDSEAAKALADPTAPGIPQSQVPISGNPVLQQLLATQKPVVIHDLDQQPELVHHDLPLRAPAKALLVVPLIVDRQIIGSISLRQFYQPRSWHPDEVELAQVVAAQAAIAVQQARLYQTTRQQAEQLLALDRQKTEFFQNVSHEFRTPLTLMIGPLEGVVAQGEGLGYDQATIALRNSRRLLRLVNQLLDIQRLDAGRMQPTFRPCDPAAFIHEIIEAFRPYCDRKFLHLVADLRPSPPLYLDMEKFDKVLYNLLSNAIKFTPAEGTITVRLIPAADTCQIEVEDTGIGIRADQLPYLFERFRQADGSSNRSHEGSGLGLALVQALVKLHSGDIAVSSHYGQGTKFTITLPLGKRHLSPSQIIEQSVNLERQRAAVELADVELPFIEAEKAAEPPLLYEHGLPETLPQILVVDDNPDLRTYVSHVLQHVGYQIRTAHNGAVAYEMACTFRPDLILTDWMMPELTGLELIQRIRSNPDLSSTPIVLLTAKVDDETRIEGVEQGADAYLGKPFNDRELLAEVRNLLALKANERRVAELNQYLTESVLRRFLPKSLVQKAALGQLQLDLKPEPRLITILFSDMVGFTQLSNSLGPQRIAELLNEYLDAMTQAIFEYGGTVDKFMGDGVLALFGAPEDLSPAEQARRAIAAARRMHQHLRHLNQRWQIQGIPPIQFRCGIHQGNAVVGMFGSAERTDFTAIGPSVNMAARLQEAAMPNHILVSEDVGKYLNSDAIVGAQPLLLKGIDDPVMTLSVRVEFDDILTSSTP
ncbi:response regulator [Pseudanabaena sp. FACHB-2040]|uniref:response regulator n=1 Tax=Pseudanabaena sp. FACHB-2040 TaxID=2692859 RepID=UPI00168908AF|nr:response regulator [Pseudanabaena sp. FACHB-2040]MBD2259223.1 response regulator [Pseudanabaena sp. FACHB-2040]